MLSQARRLNKEFFNQKSNFSVQSKLDFDPSWGFGSSSTFISNVCKLAKINPFMLNSIISNGSGYDIACAQHDTPIIYKRINSSPIIKEISFDPAYKEHLFFVYLNQKQNSKESIKHYQSLRLKDFDKAADTIKEITSTILSCTNIEAFEKLITDHEQIISDIIKTPTVKSKLF